MRKLVVLLALYLAGCSWSALSPYKVDIQQGNYVDQEMVSKLRPGMSKSQVRFALGSPLIADAFHQDRWDYVFRQQKGGGVAEQRLVTAVFDGDRLVRLDGNVFISPEFKDPQAAIEQIERDRQLPEPLGARVPGTPGPPPMALPASPPGPNLPPPPAQPAPVLAAPPQQAAPAVPAAAAPAATAKPALGYTPPPSTASPPPASSPPRAAQPAAAGSGVAAGAAVGAAAAAGAATASTSGDDAGATVKPKTSKAPSAQSAPPAPPPQQAGSFTDSIKKGFGFDVRTPPPAPPSAARAAPPPASPTARPDAEACPLGGRRRTTAVAGL